MDQALKFASKWLKQPAENQASCHVANAIYHLPIRRSRFSILDLPGFGPDSCFWFWPPNVMRCDVLLLLCASSSAAAAAAAALLTTSLLFSISHIAWHKQKMQKKKENKISKTSTSLAFLLFFSERLKNPRRSFCYLQHAIRYMLLYPLVVPFGWL